MESLVGKNVNCSEQLNSGITNTNDEDALLIWGQTCIQTTLGASNNSQL